MTIQLMSLFTGESGEIPKKSSLFTSDSLDDILQPNYLLSAISGENPLRQGDYIFASYDSGASNAIFIVIKLPGGIYQLKTYGVPGHLPNDNIFIGDKYGIPTPFPVTGDISLNNTGLTTIVNNAITSIKIADENVTTAKISDINITTSKIADSNVTTGKIANLNITTSKIADSNVITSKIADLNITTQKIADDNIISSKIANENITDAKILDNNVTTVKIGDQNVTTTKITDSNVTLAKLAPGITPTHIFIAGDIFHYGGGSAIVTIDSTGILPTDLPFVFLANYSVTMPDPTILKVVSATDQIIVTMSRDPGDSVFYVFAARAVS